MPLSQLRTPICTLAVSIDKDLQGYPEIFALASPLVWNLSRLKDNYQETSCWLVRYLLRSTSLQWNEIKLKSDICVTILKCSVTLPFWLITTIQNGMT